MFLRELFESGGLHLVDFLRENCLASCKELASTRFMPYRGIFEEPAGFTFETGHESVPEVHATLEHVRKDRKPRDTAQSIHNISDEWFKKNFGVAARSQTLFVTRSISNAWDYGVPYIAIPTSPSKVIWSKSIKDLTVAINSNFRKHVEGVDPSTGFRVDEWVKKSPENLETLREIVHEVLDGGNYVATGLAEALNGTRGELMVVTDDVVLINADADDAPDVITDLVRKVAR